MKYLRHIGLVSSLVIGGVLGGLMAPQSSEAGYVTAPTVQAQVDPCGGGNNVTISNISQATSGLVTTNGSHGFVAGDKIYIDCVTGMTQVNGMVFTVASSPAPTSNTFYLGVDTRSYVAYVTGGSASKPIGTPATITAISQANPGAVTTSAAHGLVTGDKVYIDGVAGMTQVNGLFYTITVTNTTQFMLGVNTSTYGAWSSGGKAYKYVSPPINLSLTACTDSQVAALAPGFTSCFFVPTTQIFSSAGTTRRYFMIKDVNWPACSPTPCGSPLLKVADTSSGQDAFVFTNYQFTPVKSDGTPLVSPWWGVTLPTNPVTVDNKNNIGTPGSSPPYYGETHSMRLTFNHTFDYAGNNKSVCSDYANPATCSALYQLALSVSGTFQVVSGSGTSAAGDYVRLSGTGNFGPAGWRNLLMPNNSGGACSDPNSRNSPLDVLYCPLQRELGAGALSDSPASFSSSPSLTQDDGSSGSARYPNYICDRAPTGTETTANSCKPQVIISLTATVRGPDALLLPGSLAIAGGGCTVTNNKGGTLTPQGPPCFSNSKKNLTDSTTEFFTKEKEDNLAYFASVGAHPAEACVGDQCICANPDICSGAIKITVDVTPAAARELSFGASGQGVAPFHITTNGTGYGEFEFPKLLTLYPDPWVFEALINESWWTVIPGDPQHRYDVDSIDCNSLLNRPAVYDSTGTILITPAYIVSTWTVDSSSVKTKAIVTKLGTGDLVTCNYHVHKTSQ